MDTKSPLDKLLSMAKFFHCGAHAFYNIGLVMHVGSQSMWGMVVSTDPSNTITVPPAELEEQKRYKDVFNKMLSISPDSVDVLREIYKADTHWAELVRKFRKASKDARQQDTSRLKHKLEYLPSNPSQPLSPAIRISESKSDRGVNHPMLRDAIIPWPLRLQIHEREERENDEDASEALLTAKATAALQALLNGCKDVNGKPALTASSFPSCFYADGAYDPNDPEVGLLRSEFLLRVARHIWTAPTSSTNSASTIPKVCAARAHGKYIMDPEMLGYICCQARTMLSTSAWTEKDAKYNYEKLFTKIVHLFQDPADPWTIETLKWYQKGVFGSGAPASDDEDSDNEDSEMTAILTRRAARRVTSD